LQRIAKDKSRHVDRLDLEGIQFHEKVYEGYLEQWEQYPRRIIRIDASQSLEQVVDEVFQKIKERIGHE